MEKDSAKKGPLQFCEDREERYLLIEVIELELICRKEGPVNKCPKVSC